MWGVSWAERVMEGPLIVRQYVSIKDQSDLI